MTGEIRRQHLAAPELPPGRPRLVVTGFMGTGKTESGRRAAQLLRWPFVDLDRVIERRAAMTVQEIFARRGEPEFRRLERAAVGEAARLSATVVTTGGGAALDRASFARLASDSVVAVLTCGPEELLRRLHSGKGRPLLQPDPASRVRELLAARAAGYRAAGMPLDTTGVPPDVVAARLADRVPRDDAVRIRVESPSGAYDVVVGPTALEMLAEELRQAVPTATRAAIVIDESLDAVLGDRITAAVTSAGLEPGPRLLLPAGELGKTTETLAALWTELRDLGLDRGDPVIAVGGGAALDTAGFAAATYARGLPLVNVPTTLLAMVDAALGGKVAVDHAGVKNIVGAFHHPRLVIADTSTLVTLPARALRAGLAEAIKAAVIASPIALDVIEELPQEVDGLPQPLDWVIEQSIRIKAAYVAADPLDGGLRNSLNLGHTFAHAIESASGFEVLHGEAVAVGMIAAARLGESIGITEAGLGDRLAALLLRFGLPVSPTPALDPARLAAAMGSDKKRRSGELVLVIPSPGGVDLVRGIDPAQAVRFLLGSPMVSASS